MILLVKDSLQNFSEKKVAKFVAESGHFAIEWLIKRGVLFSVNKDKEKTLLITSLQDLFKIDKKDAKNRFDRGYNYYLKIRTGITFGDTRQILAQQFTQLLTTMDSHFEQNLRNDIYQIAKAIASVDGEIDSSERAFLKAIEELWNISKENNNDIPQKTDSANEIKKFKDLLDSGAITAEEYDAKKKEILDDM